VVAVAAVGTVAAGATLGAAERTFERVAAALELTGRSLARIRGRGIVAHLVERVAGSLGAVGAARICLLAVSSVSLRGSGRCRGSLQAIGRLLQLVAYALRHSTGS